MLANLQNEMRELLDLVSETSAYAATLAARPDIEPAERDQVEQQRKSQRIVQLRERWERVMARDFDRQVAELQVRAAILNRFTRLGTPTTVAIA